MINSFILCFSDDPSIWLKNLLTVRIDKLESVKVLPWKIGVDFSILGTGHIYIILQDILRTDALLLLFAGKYFKFI